MNNNKNVLYISYDGMTDPLGQSQVIPYLLGLTKLGYQFTILSVEKKERFKKSGDGIKKLFSDVGFKWEILFFTNSLPLASKIYDQWKLNAAALRLYKKNKFDLIHCRSYVAAASGLKLVKRFNVPFLFDMRGFWVDERVDSGLWNIRNPFYHFLYKLYKKKEKKYLDQSAHIISLTQKGKEELINVYNVPEEKISVIPCCVDMEHFNFTNINEEEKKNARGRLEIMNGCKVLTYLGSMGGWYMTDEMLDFFSVLRQKDPQTIFLFITNDNRKEILEKAISKGIAANFIRVLPAKREEVPLYLSISDWSVFFIKDAYSKKGSSPTKQGEIMSMGVPIVCNDIGDTGKIIKESGVGIVIESFETDTYKRAVDRMESIATISKEKIRNAAHEYFDLKQGVFLYSNIYKKLMFGA